MRIRTERRLRRAVARRAGAAPGTDIHTWCAYCGRGVLVDWHDPEPRFEGAHLDHVIPECRNGSTSLDNTVIACAECNMTKGDSAFGDPGFLEWLSDRRQPMTYEQAMRAVEALGGVL